MVLLLVVCCVDGLADDDEMSSVAISKGDTSFVVYLPVVLLVGSIVLLLSDIMLFLLLALAAVRLVAMETIVLYDGIDDYGIFDVITQDDKILFVACR